MFAEFDEIENLSFSFCVFLVGINNQNQIINNQFLDLYEEQ